MPHDNNTATAEFDESNEFAEFDEFDDANADIESSEATASANDDDAGGYDDTANANANRSFASRAP